MKVIHKYRLTGQITIVETYPTDELLTVQTQNDEDIVVWLRTHTDNTGNPTELTTFFAVNTGDSAQGISDGARYLGTVQVDNRIVWHIFYLRDMIKAGTDMDELGEDARLFVQE